MSYLVNVNFFERLITYLLRKFTLFVSFKIAKFTAPQGRTRVDVKF